LAAIDRLACALVGGFSLPRPHCSDEFPGLHKESIAMMGWANFTEMPTSKGVSYKVWGLCRSE
jgi:hypothetical protein